jgi:hypothetical protein
MRALLILCFGGCVLLAGCDSPSLPPKPSPYRFAEVVNTPHAAARHYRPHPAVQK